jgi:dienelactone hydrolase
LKTRWTWVVLAVAGQLALAGANRADASDEAILAPTAARWIAISPSGEWVAWIGHHERGERLRVQHVASAGGLSLSWDKGFAEHAWLTGSTLIVARRWSDPHWLAIHLRYTDGRISHEAIPFHPIGSLIDPLPLRGEASLWRSFERGAGGRRETEVNRYTLGAMRQNSAGRGTRVALLRGDVRRWVVDRRGVVRAALVERDARREDGEDLSLWYRGSAADEWEKLWAGGYREPVFPLAIAANDVDLLVAAHAGRSSLGLHVFNIQERSIGQPVLVAPGFDVEGVITDYARAEPIQIVQRDIDFDPRVFPRPFQDRHRDRLRAAFPGQQAWVVSSDQQERRLIVLAHDANGPSVFFLLDAHTGTPTPLVARRSDVGPGTSRTVALEIDTADGQDRAFLTVPDRKGPIPFVVLVGGSPNPVPDDQIFHPLAQYLAAAGLAVIEIDTRRSGDYGKSVLGATRRQWWDGEGRLIEAVVESANALHPLDTDRACIAGAGYGGYAALKEVIDRPNRYRCATTFGAPTDLPYLARSGDFARSGWIRDHARDEWSHEVFTDILGDPRGDRATLLDLSPVHRAGRIQIPLLLAHGAKDDRIDVEHAYRLDVMLTLHGREPELLEIENASHSLDAEQFSLFATRLRGFLTEHLSAKPESASTP